MLAFIVVVILVGALLGLRFSVYVLFPATMIGIMIIGLGASAVFHSQGAEIEMMAAFTLALQFGFLAGVGLRNSSVRTQQESVTASPLAP